MLRTPSQIGPYRIVGQLGEGGMGAVFEGVHVEIERSAAIKMLKPELAEDSVSIQRFLNEARAANRIRHPSIVQISDHGRTPEGAVYLVMELFRGETLRQRLERLEAAGQRMPLDRLLLLTRQVAEGLAAAHDAKIIHRDLKPDNIMLVPDPAVPSGERVKILDFGIAKLQQDSRNLTMQPRPMGTVRYMSPEQCRGSEINGGTDVYALGVILYLGLAGRHPFDGDSALVIMYQHNFSQPPPLGPQAPHAPAALTQLVHRMLLKDRSQRPTMHETVQLLGELRDRHGSKSAPPPAFFSPDELAVLPAASALTIDDPVEQIELSDELLPPPGRTEPDALPALEAAEEESHEGTATLPVEKLEFEPEVVPSTAAAFGPTPARSASTIDDSIGQSIWKVPQRRQRWPWAVVLGGLCLGVPGYLWLFRPAASSTRAAAAVLAPTVDNPPPALPGPSGSAGAAAGSAASNPSPSTSAASTGASEPTPSGGRKTKTEPTRPKAPIRMSAAPRKSLPEKGTEPDDESIDFFKLKSKRKR